MYGPNITANIRNTSQINKVIQLTQVDFTRRPMFFLGKAKFTDPLSSLIYKVSTVVNMGLPCSNCGSEDKVEMHHLKHIKTVNNDLDAFGKMMAKINRKQVPLCRKCHVEVHKGIYQGKSLRYYNRR